MILVCTGTQKFPFDRLIQSVSSLKENGLSDEIIIQAGTSSLRPTNCTTYDFLSRDEMIKLTKQAEIIITHGGSGSIMNALKQGKKVIAVPRLSRYKEHVDDHQIQLVTALADAGYLYMCMDTDLLKDCIQEARTTEFRLYHSDPDRLIQDINDYLKKSEHS